jgi:hypothetical protein
MKAVVTIRKGSGMPRYQLRHEDTQTRNGFDITVNTPKDIAPFHWRLALQKTIETVEHITKVKQYSLHSP